MCLMAVDDATFLGRRVVSALHHNLGNSIAFIIYYKPGVSNSFSQRATPELWWPSKGHKKKPKTQSAVENRDVD